MKKILVLLITTAAVAACSNKTANTASTDTTNGKKVYYTAEAAANAKDAKYQIIDQEFDNMLAPDADYDKLSTYDMQACDATYVPPAEKLKKPQAKDVEKNLKTSTVVAPVKTTKNKKVVNTTNIYYVDGPNPNMPSKSSSTTTTYASDGTVISTVTK